MSRRRTTRLEILLSLAQHSPSNLQLAQKFRPTKNHRLLGLLIAIAIPDVHHFLRSLSLWIVFLTFPRDMTVRLVSRMTMPYVTIRNWERQQALLLSSYASTPFDLSMFTPLQNWVSSIKWNESWPAFLHSGNYCTAHVRHPHRCIDDVFPFLPSLRWLKPWHGSPIHTTHRFIPWQESIVPTTLRHSVSFAVCTKSLGAGSVSNNMVSRSLLTGGISSLCWVPGKRKGTNGNGWPWTNSGIPPKASSSWWFIFLATHWFTSRCCCVNRKLMLASCNISFLESCCPCSVHMYRLQW